MIDARTRCTHCGARKEQHGSAENPVRAFACPGPGTEPRWPTTIKDERRAGEVFDRRLARFWSERSTTFQGVS